MSGKKGRGTVVVDIVAADAMVVVVVGEEFVKFEGAVFYHEACRVGKKYEEGH